MAMAHPRAPFIRQIPAAAAAALIAALAVAFSLNVAALRTPFMTLSEVFHEPVTYSLPAAVRLMWGQGLYLVAVLIVSFSICFPFLKIGGLLAALLAPLSLDSRARLLAVLGALGRWSLLDVFVVMLLMVIASDQWAVGTTVHSGIFLFMGAIAIAMLSTEAMEGWQRRLVGAPPPAASPRTRAFASSLPWGIAAIGLLLLAAASLVAAAQLPMLRVDQFLLRSNQYSVVGAIETLWKAREAVFAVAMASLLLAVPLLQLLLAGIWWLAKLSPRRREGVVRWGLRAGRWSGLEVFGLALLLVVTEGRELIRTEVRDGAWVLLAAIAANATALLVLRAARRHRARGGASAA
jgi:paraquat-inducible protein A